jgi:diacylglycerol kinase (ATP)
MFGDGRALAVVNPVAGRGRAQRRLAEVVRIFRGTRARVDVVLTPAPGEATRLARDAVEEGYARVVAVGGDGTVHEVVNGIVDSSVELAIVPMGSANDFAAALGIGPWPEAARLALTAGARQVDMAIANGRAFANCVGVGVDAATVRRLERHRRVVGRLAYFSAALRTILTYRPRPVRVQMDGRTIEGRHMLVVASNGQWFGNGMRIAPGAAVDDGLLDVCFVGDTSPLESVRLLARVYRGTHVGHEKVRIERAREILIEQDSALPVQLDGELMRADRVEVRCMPGALAVVAP